MKKSKLLLPIIGVGALAASIAPAVVSCTKVEMLDCSVTAENLSLGIGDPTITFSTTKRPKSGDFTTTIKWVPQGYMYDELYAESFYVYVDETEVRSETLKDVDVGYRVVEKGFNSITITIPKQFFDDTKTPQIYFGFFFEGSEVTQFEKVDGEIKSQECYGTKFSTIQKENVSIPEDSVVEIEADLTSFVKKGFQNAYLCFAMLDDSGNPIQLTSTGSVHYGMEALETVISPDKNFLWISAPRKGWPKDAKTAQIISLTIEFDYEHKGVTLMFGQPENTVFTFGMSATNTGSAPVSGFSFSNYAAYDNEDFVTKISWGSRGGWFDPDRLYANTMNLYAYKSDGTYGGQILPAPQADNVPQYVILGHEENAMYVKIPKESIKVLQSNVGENIRFNFNLGMEESNIVKNVYLDKYEENYLESGYDVLHTSSTVSVVGSTRVEFEALLNNWGNEKTLDNAPLYFKIYNNVTKKFIKLNTGEFDYEIHYGQGIINYEYTVDNEGLKINPPAGGWGKLGNLHALSAYILFENGHSDLEFIIGTPHIG